MTIKSKNENSYLYLLKSVDLEMINVDRSNFNTDKHMENYIDSIRHCMLDNIPRKEKIHNMLDDFLKGYDFEITIHSKCICGTDRDFHNMVSFLHPYITSEKRASNMVNLLRNGVVMNDHTFSREVAYIIYDRVTIKIPKKQAHLMKIKDKERYEILSENLTQKRILQHLLGW